MDTNEKISLLRRVAWALLISSAIYIIINGSGGSLKGLLAPFTPAPSVQTSDWKTYQSPNPDYPFSLSYPSYIIVSTRANYLFSLSLPKNHFPGTDLADMSLSIGASKCSSAIENTNAEEVRINNIEFWKSSAFETFADLKWTHYFEWYRTFMNNTCYSIGLSVSAEKTESDPEQAFVVLRQILNTFKFTK